MSLSVRLEKLHFIVDELQLTDLLARHAPTAAEARMVARHALVRTHDFIEHAQALKTPLRQAGCAATAFHKIRKIYAADFETSFLTTRHRLGAHVQDLPLPERLSLWTDIELSRVSYFVDGARELHVALEALDIPGLVPFAPPPETFDDAVLAALTDWRDIRPGPAGVELASDALAMTRPDTVSMFNGAPVHERAAQLALLRRWIRSERALLARLEPFPRLHRILRARLLTDIISFTDGLTTRPLSPEAPQAMIGLDDLIREGGDSAQPIEAFLATLQQNTTIDPLRALRNRTGAHLERDANVPLAALLTDLDAWPIADALSFQNRQEAAFIKACRSADYLLDYVGDGHVMRGVTAVTRSSPLTPYDPRRPDQPAAPAPAAFDRSAFDAAIAGWRDADADADAREEAVAWLRFAASNAPVDREVRRWTRTGAQRRPDVVALRTIHVWMVEALAGTADDEAESRLLSLISLVACGEDAAFTEVLLEYAARRTPLHRPAFLHALGGIASWRDDTAQTLLRTTLAVNGGRLGVIATSALIRMFVQDQVPIRANRREDPADWTQIETELLQPFTPDQQLLHQLVLLSQFVDRDLIGSGHWFKADIARLQADVLAGLARKSDRTAWDRRKSTAAALLGQADLAGIAVLLFTELGPADDALTEELLWAICEGPAACSPQDDALRHLALCHDRVGRARDARAIMVQLCARSPESVDYQLLKLEFSIRAGDDPPADVRRDLTRLRTHYRLDDDDRARADDLEARLPANPE